VASPVIEQVSGKKKKTMSDSHCSHLSSPSNKFRICVGVVDPVSYMRGEVHCSKNVRYIPLSC
jgi:hypothetical protein